MHRIRSSRRRNLRLLTAIALILWLIPSTLQYSNAQSRSRYLEAAVPIQTQTTKVRRSSNGCQIPNVVERGEADCDTALYEDSSSISQECHIPLILVHGI